MTSATEKQVYNEAFYGDQIHIRASAGLILPFVLSVVPARTAIDVGCGVGTWAAALLEYGVADVLGVDGDYINRDNLRIPPSAFESFDLTERFRIDRNFDLAVCVEVAEHLPSTRAESFVEDLVRLAPVVLFSAALPGQGGTHHINEQYLSYWAAFFQSHGYVLVDIVRHSIWNDQGCDWWYRQNVVLFVHKDHAASGLLVPSGVDYIHPHVYETMRQKYEDIPTLGYLLRALPGSLRRSLTARISRLAGRRRD